MNVPLQVPVVGIKMYAIFKIKQSFFGIVKTEQYNDFKKTHINHMSHPKNVFVDKKLSFQDANYGIRKKGLLLYLC